MLLWWLPVASLRSAPVDPPDIAQDRGALRLVAILRGWLGVREIGYNRAPWIDRWNRARGVALGSPYCASCVSYALDSAGAISPPRSALALGLVDRTTVSASLVLSGRYVLKRGDLALWRSGDTWRGHVGTVELVIDRRTIQTLEANTSSGSGDQRDGDGFYRRRRSIEPYSYFGIKYFTRPRYRT